MTIVPGLPPIEEDVLGSVFFLHRTQSDAAKGLVPAGAGFLAKFGIGEAVYAVTARSIIEDGYTGLRFIRPDWTETYLEMTADEWVNANGLDLSVRRVSKPEEVGSLPQTAFITRDLISATGIGAGIRVATIGAILPPTVIENFCPSLRFATLLGVHDDVVHVKPQNLPGLTGAPTLMPSMWLLGINTEDEDVVPAWRIKEAIARLEARQGSRLV